MQQSNIKLDHFVSLNVLFTLYQRIAYTMCQVEFHVASLHCITILGKNCFLIPDLQGTLIFQ